MPPFLISMFTAPLSDSVKLPRTTAARRKNTIRFIKQVLRDYELSGSKTFSEFSASRSSLGFSNTHPDIGTFYVLSIHGEGLDPIAFVLKLHEAVVQAVAGFVLGKVDSFDL